MEVRSVYDIDETALRAAAALHHRTLSYRSFITAFGQEFLYQLYAAVLADRLGFLVAAEAERQLVGFVLGCRDSSKLLSVIMRRPIRFVKIMLPGVLKDPQLSRPLLETLFYAKKEGVNVNAELLVIAIEETFRSRGLGTLLLKRLDHEFLKHNIHEYKATVHKDMVRSNQFYVQNGMRPIKTFVLNHVIWNIYVKQINDSE